MDKINEEHEGTASRLQAIESEEDEVDHRIPSSWGLSQVSEEFQSAYSETLSQSNDFASSNEGRNFAPAFGPRKRRLDPSQDRSFSFASVASNQSGASDRDYYDPKDPDSEPLPKVQRLGGRASSTTSELDLNDPRNGALEGTFGSTAVKRENDELDPSLEDPDLDIDSLVRANFRPISQLYRAPVQRSPFALRNPNLVASNTSGTIITELSGETIICPPKAVDDRLSRLDRHGNYLGGYEGDIKKVRKRQFLEDIQERDRQMLQATAEYRALAAMSAEERADLLERLRRPYEWEGAFFEDQHDEIQIPEVYNRHISTTRARTWMDDDSSRISADVTITSHGDAGSASRCCPNSIVNTELHGGFDDNDEFATGSLTVPLANNGRKTQRYLRDVLDYSRKRGSRKPASQRSFTTVHPQSDSRFSREWLSNIGNSPSITPSSRGLDDFLIIDDSPEFQVPEDCPVVSDIQMTPEQEQFNFDAGNLSDTYGRVVIVQLHQLVKFTPGAIAKRVFGGIIQEMQLFCPQRVAIVIFLHPSEAKAFVRHVKNVHNLGLEEDIRALQIEASWYKGSEKPHSLLPVQSQILAHHITSNATRCLRLHHLAVNKTKEQVSAELGARLAMPLLTVILCPPRPDSYRSRTVHDPRLEHDASLGSEARMGRQAIVEFVSISDAIRAWKLLMDDEINEYEDCEPAFAADPSAEPTTERSYCKCAGCKYLRKQKELRM